MGSQGRNAEQRTFKSADAANRNDTVSAEVGYAIADVQCSLQIRKQAEQAAWCRYRKEFLEL